MYNHNKAQQSKNRVHISWDILYSSWTNSPVDGDSRLLEALMPWYGPNYDIDMGDIISYYIDVIMNAMASQINGVSIVYLTVCSGTDQRKCQSPALLAFVRGIHRWPVNSPHKGQVTRKMFPFDDVIMRHGIPFSYPDLDLARQHPEIPVSLLYILWHA